MKKQNCFFDFHVRMGDFVVYGLNGKLCMRQLPKRSKKLCKGMIVQQVRIKSVAILYRAMKDAGLLEAWRRAKKPLGWSAYNLFLQKNILVLKEDGCIGDFMSLLVTAGKVWCPKSMAACREEEAGVWRVKWLNDEQLITDDMGMAHCRRDDRLGAVLMRGDAKWFEMRLWRWKGERGRRGRRWCGCRRN